MKTVNKSFLYFFIATILLSIFLLSSIASINIITVNQNFLSFLFFLGILIAAQNLPVALPFHAEVTVDFTIFLSTIIIFGKEVSILLAFLSTVITEYKRRKTMPLYRSVFNINLYIIMVGTTAYIYEKIGGVPGELNLYKNMFLILILVFSYLLINVSLVTIALTLLERKSAKKIFFDNFKWALPNYLALSPLGVLLAVIYINIGILGVLLFLIPLLAARHSFKLYMNMRKIYVDTIQALAATLEAKDSYTHGHSDRVAEYSLIIAEELNLAGDFLNMLKHAALLHDIGKIGIPEEILNKPGKLSEWEFNKIKKHPEIGAAIVEKLDFLSKSSTFIKYHHERYDGTGYPQGLRGKNIPLGAAILAVADAFDAMTSDRPYRKAWSSREALAEIERNSGVQFYPEVVQAFRRAFDKGRIRVNAS